MSVQDHVKDRIDQPELVFHPVLEVEATAAEDLERYKLIVDELLAAKRKRSVLFRLNRSANGQFIMTVTAPKMDERQIAELIAAHLDFLTLATLTCIPEEQIMAAVSRSLQTPAEEPIDA